MAVKVDSIEEAAYIAGQAAENKRLKEENARLRAIISEPVESFGTPELVSWADKIQRILSAYPEEERGNWPFVLDMGAHLQKFVKSWNDPEMAAKDARISELEAINAKLYITIRTAGAALTPFAAFADDLDRHPSSRKLPDSGPIGFVPNIDSGLTIGDCRAARAALQEGEDETDTAI